MRLYWILIHFIPTALALLSNDTSLLWGPYRPNLYFGMRPRIPQSLMTGLMWFGTQDYSSVNRVRHACDQGDGLEGYTWTEFDARKGGVQVLKDTPNNAKVTTEFLKVPGGENGGSWAARVKGEPIDPRRPMRTSFIFYLGLEGLGGLDMDNEEDDSGIKGPISWSGSTPELDEFRMRVVDSPGNKAVTEGRHSDAFSDRIGKNHVLGLRVPPGDLWKARDYIMNNLITRAQPLLREYTDPNAGPPDPSFVLQLSDDVYSGSNLFAVQKTFDGAFQFDIFYESVSAEHDLDSSTLDEGIPELTSWIDSRFDSAFPTPSPVDDTPSRRAFSKAITANLMGGIGYFYGTSLVDAGFAYEWDQEDDAIAGDAEDHLDPGVSSKGARLTEPKALLTATPSRSFFPRGFYWDEGFHLLHIGVWDNDLSLEILKDWVNLIDEDGWVAREQILGEEARSKVPAEFQVQVPTNANPPTLVIAVAAYVARLKAAAPALDNSDLGMDYGMGAGQVPMNDTASTAENTLLSSPETAMPFLRSIYKPLKRHYEWFRRTQRGQIKQYSRKARSRSEAYRWRGRSAQHVLTSGMDDYPRGPPHSGELHLDLISWMAFFSRTMKEIASFIGEADDAASFSDIERAILGNIEDLHWSEEQNMYCDVGVNSEDESYHVCHKGYLSLFPFLLRLLPPTSPHIGHILDMLHDPEQLWSPYGIRSLSASHPDFGMGENYWKGPIWIQMNYLALSALHKTYAVEEGPYKAQSAEIYDQLRRNVVDNVFKEYERTGYVWEQYDPKSGEGRRSHPFTGWTSLISLVMSEVY